MKRDLLQPFLQATAALAVLSQVAACAPSSDSAGDTSPKVTGDPAPITAQDKACFSTNYPPIIIEVDPVTRRTTFGQPSCDHLFGKSQQP